LNSADNYSNRILWKLHTGDSYVKIISYLLLVEHKPMTTTGLDGSFWINIRVFLSSWSNHEDIALNNSDKNGNLTYIIKLPQSEPIEDALALVNWLHDHLSLS